MSDLDFLNPIRRTAKRVSKSATSLESKAAIAEQKLAQLDDRLKKGLISKSAYDKLARIERATLAYLAKPIHRKDEKIAIYSGLLDKAFILAVLTLVSTTLFLQYKYGRIKKPRAVA